MGGSPSGLGSLVCGKRQESTFQHFYHPLFPRGVQRWGGNQKLKDFHLLQCKKKEELGSQVFDSCPKSSAGFVVLYTLPPSRKHQQPWGNPDGEPHAAPSRASAFKTPQRFPPSRTHFCKSLSSRHHSPARTLQASVIRHRLGVGFAP